MPGRRGRCGGRRPIAHQAMSRTATGGKLVVGQGCASLLNAGITLGLGPRRDLPPGVDRLFRRFVAAQERHRLPCGHPAQQDYYRENGNSGVYTANSPLKQWKNASHEVGKPAHGRVLQKNWQAIWEANGPLNTKRRAATEGQTVAAISKTARRKPQTTALGGGTIEAFRESLGSSLRLRACRSLDGTHNCHLGLDLR